MENHVFADVVKHPEHKNMEWDLEQGALNELVMHSALLELCESILYQLNSMGAE